MLILHIILARARPVENLSQQEKNDINENMLRMKQMFDRLGELLPVFLQMTSNVEATRRLILMKHLYEEQFKLLPQQTYIVTLDQLNLLRDQLSRYFNWVRLNVSGPQMGGMQQPGVSQPPSMGSQPPTTAATTVSQMPQAPQPQPPSATQAPQQQQQHVPSPMPQQQQAVRPPVSMSQSPQQMTAEQVPTSNAMGIKRASIDLKLPPSKKQRAAANQQQQQPQEAGVSSAPSPAVAAQQAAPSSPATMLQTGQAPPPAMGGGGPIATNNVSPQELQQAALARGFPAELLRVLPEQALQWSWVLTQAEKKALSLNPQSIDYLRKMLDMAVNAARRQLEQQQQQQQQNVATTTETPQQQHTPSQQRTPSVTSIRSSPAMTPAAASTPATNAAATPAQQPPPPPPPASASTPSMAAASRPATTPMTTPATIAATTSTATPATVATTPTTLTTTPTAAAAAVSTPMASQVATTPTISRPQLSTTPSQQQRPGMNAENKVVNTMMYANDVLKDVASILAQKTPDDAPEKIALDVMREGPHCAYAFDASPFKEGYKDETFSLALDRGSLGKNEITKDNEPADPSTDWYEPGMMDPGIIGMNEIMRGFEWDESGAMISS